MHVVSILRCDEKPSVSDEKRLKTNKPRVGVLKLELYYVTLPLG